MRGSDDQVERVVVAEAHGLRVLVVDDDQPSLTVCSLALRSFGCDVLEATDGQVALAHALTDPGIDMIFMDIHLPRLSGIEVTRCIRERERQSGWHVPIIAVTASAMPHECQHCIDAGMDEVLTTPLFMVDLRRALIRWGKSSHRGHGPRCD